ncbi:proton-coupled amino acid transporter-like protein CG1139 [Orussus abietinus]|uniref:proton-coupled amino acid transporter-like protein CG1139 n=1 Tax=Orussus abietinus TaxID=222816 RepID=UPI000C7161F2|nr:proton-coupled amino acid transporter-like protein CG1139 [Orussus abietinus]
MTCYIGIGAVYVVFISGIVQECVDAEKTISQGYYALILFPLFLAMNMTRNLKDLAPLSAVGNTFLLTAAIIGVVYSLKDGIGTTHVMVQEKIELYPKFLGTVFFSMCSPGLILEIEHCMKKPKNYLKPCGVLNWGMAVLIMVHVFVGVVGYLKWGSEAVGNFIRNHVENDPATMTALIMQALAIYFSYGLQCYMPIMILNKDYALPAIQEGIFKGTPYFWDLVIRIGVSLVTCKELFEGYLASLRGILGAAIPKLDLFLGLVGAVCIATLGVLIPCTLYLVVNYGNYGRFKWRLVLGVVLLIIGLVAMLCASITSLVLIVRFFHTG